MGAGFSTEMLSEDGVWGSVSLWDKECKKRPGEGGKNNWYMLAPEIFDDLGAQIESMFINPDGKNINANCGSQHPEALARKVVENSADIGLAFDGDGDRLIVSDEKGNIIRGDQILAICARNMATARTI